MGDYADADVQLVTFSDERYPDCLRELSDLPLLLYVRGDAERPGIDGRTPTRPASPIRPRQRETKAQQFARRPASKATKRRPCNSRGAVAN